MMKGTYSVEQATIHDVPQLAVLFNQYRVFYGQASDVEGAKQFLLDRFNHAESIILVAKENKNVNMITNANINKQFKCENYRLYTALSYIFLYFYATFVDFK
jgi:hypothetical protein